MKGGTLDIPVSNYIDVNNRVQSIEMKNFEPSFNTADELFNILETSHLPSHSVSKIYECCEKYFDAFSRHDFDSGRSKSTTAFVELTTNKQVTQKFYPIPQNAQNEVDAILEQLIKNNIIREAELDEQSQFINCLLITRKKSGKIRLLLDSRICNIHSKKRQRVVYS